MSSEYKYIPYKLIGTRKKFIDRYQGKNRIAHNVTISNCRFEELIEEIKEQKVDELPFFTRWLTNRDIFLLANRFSSIEGEKVRIKVLQIFNIRGPEQVIKQIFEVFIENWNDTLLKNFLLDVLEKKKSNFPPTIWTQILKSSNIEVYIGNYLCIKNQNIVETLKELAINKNTRLVYECKYIAYCSGTKFFLTTQDTSQMIMDLSLFTLDRLKKVTEHYLLVMDQNELNNDLMVFFLKKIGKPGQKKSNWEGIVEQAQEKFRNWFYTSELERFFSNDIKTGKVRFNFWKQYLKSIKSLRFDENGLILILDFGRYIIVEFGETGNAAYIYSKDIFLRKFGELDRAINLKISQLKEQEIAWGRILHRGYWQYRAAFLMRTVLGEGV